MKSLMRWLIAPVAMLLAPAPVVAQPQPAAESAVRPASAGATFLGDTGLWYVPAAEVLPAGVWNAGFSAASETRDRGAVKPSYGAMSAARGVGHRTELFGSWHLTTDVEGRRGRGDLLAGAKIGLLSERRGSPVAVAARVVLKVPTGNDEIGASSGRADLLTEVVASRHFGRTEVTGSTGLVFRGNPRGVDQPNGVRSGAGVAFMAHRAIRLFAELQGEAYRGGERPARLVSPLDTPTSASAGVSWLIADRFAASVGVNRALGSRDEVRGMGAAVRVGYSPGTRRATAVAAPTSRPAPANTGGAPSAPPARPASSAAPAESAGRGSPVLALDDIHFDLDRHTLRPDAFVVLDRAVAALRENPTLRLQLDGHTCEIGTTEYNFALGARRAAAVRDYLVSRGVAADRLQATSYGEERPKHGTRTEDTRALNRRVELRPVTSTGRQ